VEFLSKEERDQLKIQDLENQIKELEASLSNAREDGKVPIRETLTMSEAHERLTKLESKQEKLRYKQEGRKVVRGRKQAEMKERETISQFNQQYMEDLLEKGGLCSILLTEGLQEESDLLRKNQAKLELLRCEFDRQEALLDHILELLEAGDLADGTDFDEPERRDEL